MIEPISLNCFFLFFRISSSTMSTPLVLKGMDFYKPESKELAYKAYNRLLKRIHEHALECTDDCRAHMIQIIKLRTYTVEETEIIYQALFTSRIVTNCFSVARSRSPLLSAVALEILLSNMFKSHVGKMDIHIEKCVVVFDTGGMADHYVVRVIFKRLLPSRSAYVHLDVGSRLYCGLGLQVESTVYGGVPPEKRMWFDEIDAEATKLKKRNALTFSIWSNLLDRERFLKMISRSLNAEDRIAIHLAIGRVHPSWDDALGYMELN